MNKLQQLKDQRSIHIQHLSRLYKASPSGWERLLKDMTKEQDGRRATYAPLRMACLREMKAPGSGAGALELMLSQWRSNPGTNAIKSRSREHFQKFLQLRPLLGQLDVDLVNRRVKNIAVPFEGGRLIGAFHAVCVSQDGNQLLIYFSPSKSTELQKRALGELLALFAERHYALPRTQVVVVDFDKNTCLPPKSYSSVKKELEATMRLYLRVDWGKSSHESTKRPYLA